MTREELFEIKKDITIVSDFENEFRNEVEKKRFESLKTDYNDGYKAMSAEDQQWLDGKFVQWIEIYMSRNEPKHCGAAASSCSGCSC